MNSLISFTLTAIGIAAIIFGLYFIVAHIFTQGVLALGGF